MASIPEGRKIGIPFGRAKWCAVAALDQELDAAGKDVRSYGHGRYVAF
jgi:hypothetical protein